MHIALSFKELKNIKKLKEKYPHLHFFLFNAKGAVKSVKTLENILKNHRCSIKAEECPLKNPG